MFGIVRLAAQVSTLDGSSHLRSLGRQFTELLKSGRLSQMQAGDDECSYLDVCICVLTIVDQPFDIL